MERDIRILFVGSSEDELNVLNDEIGKNGYQPTFTQVANLNDFETKINNHLYDIIFVDAESLNGFCAEFASVFNKKKHEIPCLMLVEASNEETAIKYMNNGVDDYVIKNNRVRLTPLLDKLLNHYEIERKYRQLVNQVSKTNLKDDDSTKQDKIDLPISLYKPIVERVRAGIFIMQDYELKYCNMCFAQMFGFSHPDLIIGMQFEQLMAQDDWDQFLSHFKNAASFSDHDFDKVTFQARKKDGSLFDAEMDYSQIDDEEMTAIQGVLHDISELKKAEKALLISQDRLELALSGAELGMWDWQIKKDVLIYNERFASMLGFTMDSYLKKVISFKGYENEVHPNDRQLFSDALERHLQQKTPFFECEYRLRGKGENWIWILDRGKVVARKDNGEPRRMVGTHLEIHQRKLAEKALKESEEKYRTVVERSNDGIAIVQNLKIRFVNERVCEMLGLPKEQILNKPFKKFIHRNTIPHILTFLKRKINVESTEPVFETMIKTADNKELIVEIRSSLITFNSGKADLVYLKDVTENKKAEQALLKSEYQNKAILEAIPDLMFRLDRDGVFLDYRAPNPEKLYVPPDRFVGKNIADVLPKTLARLTMNHIKKALKTGKLQKYEYQLLLDDKLTHQEARLVSKNHNEVLAIVRDITEWKEAQAALKISEERYRSIVENSHSGILIVDDNFRFEYMNEQLTKILGYTQQELLGEDFRNHLDEESKNLVIRNYINRQRGIAVPSRYEFNVIHKSGEKRRVEISSAIVKSTDNKIKTIAQILDITECTQTLQQLKASLKEKDVLLKEIHHRVKNNLQVISSLLYLQSKNINEEQALNIFQESKNRIQSMSLIHEKLYQSKNLAQINFFTYIRELTRSLFNSYSTNYQKVKLNLDVQNIRLNIDMAIPCGLIINELVSNSLKYAFPGNCKGEINISFKKNNRQTYLLQVGDTGVGLPENFDVRNAQTLGLKLINALVDQLNGEIELVNVPGTVFQISFNDKFGK